jgi:hypothetical protein
MLVITYDCFFFSFSQIKSLKSYSICWSISFSKRYPNSLLYSDWNLSLSMVIRRRSSLACRSFLIWYCLSDSGSYLKALLLLLSFTYLIIMDTSDFLAAWPPLLLETVLLSSWWLHKLVGDSDSESLFSMVPSRGGACFCLTMCSTYSVDFTLFSKGL